MRQRNANYHRIKDTLNFRRKNSEKIEDHRLVFWMGDLNYRLTNHETFHFKDVAKACTLDDHHKVLSECMGINARFALCEPVRNMNHQVSSSKKSSSYESASVAAGSATNLLG
ncbi:hypothetical protein Ddc_11116 [Ditylenchus destructor]|nr:hypothetical protein Ddc_11116 [Ditylenchus destructor]